LDNQRYRYDLKIDIAAVNIVCYSINMNISFIIRKWVRKWTKKEGESARLLSMRVLRCHKSSIPVAGSKREASIVLLFFI